MKVNQQEKSLFWLRRSQSSFEGEPQVKDVCSTCNNEVLSDLDTYICSLFDSTIVRMPARHEEVEFAYSYHLLKRWLLKTAYNSARIHQSADVQGLQRLAPYVLGKDDRLGRTVSLFAQLAYPEPIPREAIPEGLDWAAEELLWPSIHRIGHLLFRAADGRQKLLRTVVIRSFHFYLAFWFPSAPNHLREDFERSLDLGLPESRRLRAGENSALLACNGCGAWRSFRDSQSASLRFNQPLRDE